MTSTAYDQPTSEADEISPALAEARDRLDATIEATTQREWLQITRALDRTRVEIQNDPGLILLTGAWVRRKHEKGGADWGPLLDMNDDQLLAELGFPTDDDEPELPAGVDAGA